MRPFFSLRRSTLLAAGAISLLGLGPIASCQVPAAPIAPAVAASLPRSLWVWDATVMTNPPHAEELLSFCKQKGISVIYISLGDVFLPSKREPTDPRHVTTAQLAAFIRTAHAQGIQVEGLDGDPSFALTAKHEMTLKRLQRALMYNRQVEPEARLDGWQWDTEPYILKEFKESEESARDILIQYLDSAAQMRDAVKTQPGFKLGYAIPSFFDSANRTVKWNGVSKPAGFHLMDILNTVPGGYIAIMAYREKADGTNGTIAISQGEVDYSAKSTPNVKVWIGQETGAVKGDPETVTFWEEGEEAMEIELAKVNTHFATTPAVGGIAIHHWVSYKDISSRGVLAVTSPAKGAAVDRTATITGTAKTAEVGAKVLVSVRPEGDTWYPQGESPVKDGQWAVPCRFGNETTPAGRKFDIKVELVTEDGSPLARIEQSTQTK